MKKIVLTAAFAAMFLPLFASWDALKTDQFTVFYEPAYKSKAMKVLSALEYYKHIPEDIVGNRCGNLPVVLDDYGQYINGFANPVYYNIHLINYENDDADWISFVAVHEYTHMVHMTMTGGIPGILSFLFGNLAGTMLFAPQWTWEAVTVYNESKMSKYMGRLNDGIFDTYMKICSSADEFPSLMKATYTPLEFPYGTGIYLFGGEFLNFLAVTYGEDKLKKFYENYSTSVGSYFSPVFPWLGIDRTFDEAFGGTTETLWAKWKEYEKERAKDYKQEGEKITDRGDFASWPSIKGDKLYYARNTLEKTGAFEARSYNKIIAVDLKSGTENVIACTTSSYPQPFRYSGNKMYYAVSDIRPGYANKSNLSYGNFTVIYERNLDTGAEKAVLAGEIRAFFVPYEGKIIYAKDDPYRTGSELYEYDLEKGENRLLFDSGYLVFALAGNAENMFAAARTDGDNTGIYSVDKLKKTFTAIASTPYYEDQPELYGDRLFFRANYGKIYSSYCYDLKTKKIYRLTKNGSAGTPAYYEPADEIYFAGAGVKGFDLYKMKAEFKPFTLPEDKQDFVMPPAIEESKLKTGGYLDNMATLFPKIRMPLGYYDSETAFAGLGINGADAIGDFNYTATGIYDFKQEVFQYSLSMASYVFSPAVLYMYSDNIDDRNRSMMNIGVNVPLYRSIRPGISNISVWVEHMFFDGFARRQLSPGMGIIFSWPCFEMGASINRAFEGAWLGSMNASRQGTMGNVFLRQFIPEGKLEIRGRGIYDPDNSDNVVPGIRGYAHNVTGNAGSAWVFEFSKPVWKIRTGLWNPVNFYIEDLCAKAFFDAAFADNTQLSYGLELHLETKWFNIFPADIGIRAGMNGDNRFFWGPIVGIQGLTF